MTSHASSQKVPVGVSTPSKPSFSAVRAMSARYSMVGGRNALGPLSAQPAVRGARDAAGALAGADQ